jgi:hypothetical protein
MASPFHARDHIETNQQDKEERKRDRVNVERKTAP